jgi:GINS complex subunit 2
MILGRCASMHMCLWGVPVCMSLCMCGHACAHMCVVCLCTSVLCVHVCTLCICVGVCIVLCLCTRVHMCVSCVSMYVHACLCACVCVYMCVLHGSLSCVLLCVFPYMCAMYLCAYVCTCVLCAYTCHMPLCGCTCIAVCLSVYMCVHICATYLPVHAYMYVSAHVCVLCSVYMCVMCVPPCMKKHGNSWDPFLQSSMDSLGANTLLYPGPSIGDISLTPPWGSSCTSLLSRREGQVTRVLSLCSFVSTEAPGHHGSRTELVTGGGLLLGMGVLKFFGHHTCWPLR